MFYSSTILSATGLPANYITALVGFVNFISVLPTLYLYKRFGRKPLLWFFSFLIAGSLIAMGVMNIINSDAENDILTAFSIVFLMLFIVFFEFSLGPLLWIYMSEIMTEKGLSIGCGVNWIAAVCIAYFTPDLIDALGGNNEGSGILFCGCGGITVITALFCLFVVKETKGLSEKEVQSLYSKNTQSDVQTERDSLIHHEK